MSRKRNKNQDFAKVALLATAATLHNSILCFSESSLLFLFIHIQIFDIVILMKFDELINAHGSFCHLRSWKLFSRKKVNDKEKSSRSKRANLVHEVYLSYDAIMKDESQRIYQTFHHENTFKIQIPQRFINHSWYKKFFTCLRWKCLNSTTELSILWKNHMNPFDTFIIILFGYCLIRGFFRGLIKELSSIAGVLTGFYCGYTYYGDVAKRLAVWIHNQAYSNILGFLLIFCCVFIIISVLGVIIKYLMNIAFLGWIDRIGGIIFGVVKAVLISSILLIVLTAFLPKGASLISESVLSPRVSHIAEIMSTSIPKDIKQEFSTKFMEIKKIWNLPLWHRNGMALRSWCVWLND